MVFTAPTRTVCSLFAPLARQPHPPSQSHDTQERASSEADDTHLLRLQRQVDELDARATKAEALARSQTMQHNDVRDFQVLAEGYAEMACDGVLVLDQDLYCACTGVAGDEGRWHGTVRLECCSSTARVLEWQTTRGGGMAHCCSSAARVLDCRSATAVLPQY